MKNTLQKIFTKVFISTFVLVMAFVFTNQAFAGAVSWANPNTFGPISNVSGTGVVQSTTYSAFNYQNSISAQAGDKVSVLIYIHNSGNADSTNTMVKLSQPSSGAQTSFNFSGSVSGGGASKSGSTSVTLSSSQTLTYIPGSLRVSKDRGPGYSVANDTDIFTSGGLNIGTIAGMNTCGTDALCHQGSVAVGFQVSNTTTPPPTYLCSNGQDDDGDGLTDYPSDPGCTSATDNNEYNIVTPTVCSIDYFNSSPSTVTSGGYTTLSWATTNCTTVTIDGVNYPSDGSGSFGPLFQGKTYTINANNTTSSDSENEYVSVTNPTTYQCNDGYDNDGDGLVDMNDPGCSSTTDNSENNIVQSCVIDYFNASPSTVTSGGYTTLSWATTNCTTVTIDGVNYAVDGSSSFGPLYSGRTYTINAYNNTNSDTENEYVGITSQNNYQCNDGYDNDGDGRIDMNDEGCNSSTDDSEYNYTNTNNCTIDTYYASPTTVVSSGSTRLYWETSNCDQVTIDGINYAVDGNGYFGPLYTGRNYEIRAWRNNQTPRYQTVYVGVNQTTAPVGTYACNDNIDNDNDGRIDFPSDPGCLSSTDNDEYNTTIVQNPVVTTLNPTNLTNSTGRINGSVINGGGNTTSLYFEWGTAVNNLPNRTNTQSTSSDNSVTFYDTIRGLTVGQTYFYRAVAVKNDGTILRGEVKQFQIFNTPVVTPTVTTTQVIRNVVTRTPTPVITPEPDRGVIVGMGTNLVQLRYLTTDTFNTNTVNTGGFGINTNNQNGTLNQNINNGVQNVCVNDTVKFVVEYRNISTITLSNAILHIDIPKDVEFRSSSSGVYNKADNTITINVGTLTPGQTGTISFDGVVQSSAANRDLLVVPATLSFENPNNGARETAVAYGLATTQNCVRNTNGLAGLAFGGGFFPNTLFGWLLLALVLLALIYLIRRWFMVYPITRYSSNKRTTQSTHSPRYEDMDIPTAPYQH